MERHLLSAAIGLLVPLFAALTPVHAEPGKMFYESSQGGSINEDGTPTPLLQSRELLRVWENPGNTAVGAANTNKIFMNRCAGGCIVTSGNTDSTTNRSSIGGGQLSAFSQGDATWNNVMQCMREVFGPFNVVITDVDPGTAPHFEIMVAGQPQQIGLGGGVGGISPFTCNSYIPNSLVFVFDVWGGNVEEICSTAAQELAHSFALDHVIDPSDPLTYFGFNGRRRFKDAQVQCGSDCVGGQSPFGAACSGPNQQSHVCACGGNTQNSVQTIKALFGNGLPTPPTVKINNPKVGQQVMPGFPVQADVTDDQGVAKVELRVDGTLVLSLATGPYAFNAPATLGDGTHTAEITGIDVFGAVTKKSVQVIIGKPCGKPADCPKDTDTCIGGRCVPGPGAQGGLGSTCVTGTECASGNCVNSTDGGFCVEDCQLGAGQCPEGFGCLENGEGGVCFPGYDDGTGGGCSSSNGGPIGFGLGFAAILFVRRRRRS